MFMELDRRHDARYSIALEWDLYPVVVADSGASSVLVLPMTGESAGEGFRHPFRYAP